MVTKVVVVAGVDANPRYKGTKDLFIKSWQQTPSRLKNVVYEPLVINIRDGGEVGKFRQSGRFEWTLDTQLPTAFVSQMVRLIAPPQITADFVVTSDIDMLSLNPRLVDRSLSHLLSEHREFVVARNVLPYGQFPICYNIGSPAAWKKLFAFPKDGSVEDFLKSVFTVRTAQTGYESTHGGLGWFADQEILFEKINELFLSGFRIAFLTDRETGHCRLDRATVKNPLQKISALKAAFAGLYTDYHIHLPVQKHQKLISLILYANSLGESVRSKKTPLKR